MGTFLYLTFGKVSECGEGNFGCKQDSLFDIWKDPVLCPCVKEMEPVCVYMYVCLSVCGEEYGEKS